MVAQPARLQSQCRHRPTAPDNVPRIDRVDVMPAPRTAYGLDENKSFSVLPPAASTALFEYH
jgi:hypothetical protein